MGGQRCPPRSILQGTPSLWSKWDSMQTVARGLYKGETPQSLNSHDPTEPTESSCNLQQPLQPLHPRMESISTDSDWQWLTPSVNVCVQVYPFWTGCVSVCCVHVCVFMCNHTEKEFVCVLCVCTCLCLCVFVRVHVYVCACLCLCMFVCVHVQFAVCGTAVYPSVNKCLLQGLCSLELQNLHTDMSALRACSLWAANRRRTTSRQK